MGSRSLGTLTLDLVAKTGGFVAGMSKAERESDKFKRKLKRNMDDAAKAIRNVAVVASGALAGAFGAVAAASAKQEAALKQVEQRLISTNNAVGKSTQELAGLAAELQKVSTFGDEDILEAQSQLLTFTNIAGETFDRTLTSVLNLSTAMNVDLKSSVLQLGKALNDPVANLSALSRAGIQFSDQQQVVIKDLAETGRLAEAQAVILAELETQFGGAAEAAADTFGGALKQVQNAFGDLLENPAGLKSTTAELKQLTEFLQDPETVRAAQQLTGALISGFQSVATAVKDTLGAVKFLAEEFAAIRFGAASDDLVRLEEQLDKTRSAIENPTERLRFFGPNGVIEYWNEEELRVEVKRLETAIETERSRLEDQFSRRPVNIAPVVAANDPVMGAVSASPAIAGALPAASSTMVDQTKDTYEAEVVSLEEYRQKKADVNAEWDEDELSRKREHDAQMAMIDQNRRDSEISALGDFFGQVATLRTTDSKEGHETAKKAAIVQATINAYMAATGAYASASSIPVVGWVLGPIAAAAALAAGLANVSAIRGQAHDGIMSVPESGTWNLQKGERVLTQDTSAKLDKVLDDVRMGRGGGGRGGVVQNINVAGDIDRRTQTQIANETARKQRMAQARFA